MPDISWVATGCLHGTLPELPAADLALITGDIFPVCNHDLRFQEDWLHSEFVPWAFRQPVEEMIVVAGNHDFFAQTDRGHDILSDSGMPFTYLRDESVEMLGLKIHGTPWTPTFFNWAFMADDDELRLKWDLIPDDTDILVSHGPRINTGDKVSSGKCAGSVSMGYKMDNDLSLKLHVYSHIHEAYGVQVRGVDGSPKSCNVSHMDLNYNPVNQPIVGVL